MMSISIATVAWEAGPQFAAKVTYDSIYIAVGPQTFAVHICLSYCPVCIFDETPVQLRIRRTRFQAFWIKRAQLRFRFRFRMVSGES